MIDRKIASMGMLFVLTAATVLFLNSSVVETQEQIAALGVIPEVTTVRVGSTFSVNVTFENIPTNPGAAGFEFNLSWNPSVLEPVSMQEVLFHTVTPQSEWDNIWGIKHTVQNNSVFYA